MHHPLHPRTQAFAHTDTEALRVSRSNEPPAHSGRDRAGPVLSPVGVEEGLPGQAPLRVLLVIKCLGYGGAERLLVDTVATADRRRFDYEVAYVLREQDALVPAMRAGGTPVHSLGAAHNADLRWMAALRRLLVIGHYDVVHFHLPYAAALGQLVVASFPAPLDLASCTPNTPGLGIGPT